MLLQRQCHTCLFLPHVSVVVHMDHSTSQAFHCCVCVCLCCRPPPPCQDIGDAETDELGSLFSPLLQECVGALLADVDLSSQQVALEGVDLKQLVRLMYIVGANVCVVVAFLVVAFLCRGVCGDVGFAEWKQPTVKQI